MKLTLRIARHTLLLAIVISGIVLAQDNTTYVEIDFKPLESGDAIPEINDTLRFGLIEPIEVDNKHQIVTSDVKYWLFPNPWFWRAKNGTIVYELRHPDYLRGGPHSDKGPQLRLEQRSGGFDLTLSFAERPHVKPTRFINGTFFFYYRESDTAPIISVTMALAATSDCENRIVSASRGFKADANIFHNMKYVRASAAGFRFKNC